MASINVSFDSITKAGKITVDGAEVSDISQFNMYGMGADRFQLEMYSRVDDKATGISTMTRVCAAKDGSLVQIPADKQLELVTAEAVKTEVASPELTQELLKSVAKHFAK